MLRRIVALGLSVTLLTVPALAQPATTDRLEIDMSSFKYMPATITLKHGQPYDIRFVNKANGSHDFVAKAFFAAAQIAPGDRKLVSKGELELQGGEAANIHLVAPAIGRYEAHCSHFMHSTFGMKAEIIVT